jgi:hypothetical protein
MRAALAVVPPDSGALRAERYELPPVQRLPLDQSIVPILAVRLKAPRRRAGVTGNSYTPKRSVRPHPTDPTAALVELTKGYWAVIDAADAVEVGRFNWCAKKQRGALVYGQRAYRVDGILRSETLHRFIGSIKGLSLEAEVDHENGNGLDCRRHNLRDASHWQNMANTSARSDNRSGVKGVAWDPSREKWRAHLSAAGVQVLNKSFNKFDDAVTVVAEARQRFHGEFANHGTRKELLQ